MRTIKFKTLTSTEVVVINSDVRTLGEFQKLPEVSQLGIDWNSCKLVDRASHASFEVETSVLPAINCIMFLVPTHTKSGIDWSQASYKECKKEVKNLYKNGTKLPFNYTQASTKQLQDFLEDYYNIKEAIYVPTKVGEIMATLEIAQNLLKSVSEAVDDLEVVEEGNFGSYLVEYVTEDDLVDEQDKLVKMFK